jgi:hypothetical protein
MARPKKHNVEYFTHDVQMRNDVKIKALRRKYKHLGYAIYIITLELLGDAEYFEIKWDDETIELLLPEYDCDIDELIEVINYCIKLNLLQLSHGYLHCEKFTNRLEDTVLTRRTGYCKENSQIYKLKEVFVGNNEFEKNLNEVYVDINAQSKVKERKVKESKVKESKVKESKVKETTENLQQSVTTNNSFFIPNHKPIYSSDEFDNLFNLKTNGKG